MASLSTTRNVLGCEFCRFSSTLSAAKCLASSLGEASAEEGGVDCGGGVRSFSGCEGGGASHRKWMSTHPNKNYPTSKRELSLSVCRTLCTARN